MSKDYKIKRMRRKKRMAEIERDTLEIENAALRERVAELEGVIEAAYREGFQDGFDHGNLSYKYPAVDQAWQESEALAASKRAGDAEVAESAERMADKHEDTLRSLADGPHDHDHIEEAE